MTVHCFLLVAERQLSLFNMFAVISGVLSPWIEYSHSMFNFAIRSRLPPSRLYIFLCESGSIGFHQPPSSSVVQRPRCKRYLRPGPDTYLDINPVEDGFCSIRPDLRARSLDHAQNVVRMNTGPHHEQKFATRSRKHVFSVVLFSEEQLRGTSGPVVDDVFNRRFTVDQTQRFDVRGQAVNESIITFLGSSWQSSARNSVTLLFFHNAPLVERVPGFSRPRRESLQPLMFRPLGLTVFPRQILYQHPAQQLHRSTWLSTSPSLRNGFPLRFSVRIAGKHIKGTMSSALTR
ncbi:hypothetical protein C8R45DRAFT_543008 [Mycena sanguinolenta]|nr:hypothetical protein C8R45DRAFT_543008 [Mycena sanguinolenta]